MIWFQKVAALSLKMIETFNSTKKMWSLLSTPGISANIKFDSVHCDPLPCMASGSRCHTADYLNETKEVDSNVPCLSSSLLKSPSVSTNIKSDSVHCDPMSCMASWKGRSHVPVQVLQRGRRHRIIIVMTSSCQVMIQGFVEDNWREGQDNQVVGFKAITTKGDLKNEQDKGERGVEVDGRGDKLCRDGELLLWEFSFSQIQVPQGWIEKNYTQ